MADSVLTAAERKLLSELERRGVRFLVIGMSAALLQGARGATEDIDLWFEDVDDSRLADAVRTAGGIWISGAFGLGPPRIGGDALGERLDVVTRVDGLDAFDVEYQRAHREEVVGLMLSLLPLERILASKRASGRPKDLLAAHLIEDAIIAKRDDDSDVNGDG